MAFSHTVGGTTFTEANFEGNAYSNESTGFPKALEKMVEHVANAYRGTSTTSNAVGTGSKTWTVTNANSQIPAFAVGMPVRVSRTSAPATTYMQGEITAFTAATGSTTVNVSSSLGSGTHTDWTITIGGHQTTAAASPLAIADGGTGAATAAAARTALGVADAESTFAGVLETNANFVDQVIFGPSVDGRPWNGKWSVASLYSSLMLATIEDTGADTEVNIWDLTEQSGGAISTTPLGTVTLSGDATPTSVAACMGYIIVGSEDGISIIDPHGGSWAERTVGWPKSLSTSTSPALAANDINQVMAFVAEDNPFDPLTGGKIPYFVAGYASGTTTKSIIMPSGAVYEDTYLSAYNLASAEMYPGIVAQITSGNLLSVTKPLANTTADANLQQFGIGTSDVPGCPTGVTCGDGNGNGTTVFGGTSGLDRFLSEDIGQSITDAGSGESLIRATTNRTYTTGFQVGDIRGAWLANSKTADRSVKANTLTENGTVTEAAVASGAELNGYSGFSSSNNLTRASDADWDVLGTSAACWSAWFKSDNVSTTETLCGFANAGNTIRFNVTINGSGVVDCVEDGASAAVNVSAGSGLDDGVWHKVDFVRRSSTEREVYIDGVLVTTNTTDTGSLSSSGNLPLSVGVDPDGSSTPASTLTLALAQLSATAPTATQIRQMYDAEKGMLEADAECLLQSGSTDAVLDVDVDPLAGKVLVTQTDAITVFDGLVVDSKPTVNSGSSEKGKLWGDLRAEQNSANAYVTAPAVDQRQVNEMVRGLASDLPKGVDRGKCSAWLELNGTSTISITSSYNIKSVTDLGTGSYEVFFATPFKSRSYVAVGSGGQTANDYMVVFYKQTNKDVKKSIEFSSTKASTAALVDNSQLWCAFFGELENE